METKDKYDFEFEPLRHEDGRLIVAEERDWQQFGLASVSEVERFGNRTPKIFINCETLFAGHEDLQFYTTWKRG